MLFQFPKADSNHKRDVPLHAPKNSQVAFLTFFLTQVTVFYQLKAEPSFEVATKCRSDSANTSIILS